MNKDNMASMYLCADATKTVSYYLFICIYITICMNVCTYVLSYVCIYVCLFYRRQVCFTSAIPA